MARPHEMLLEAVAQSLRGVGMRADVDGSSLSVGTRYYACASLHRKTSVRFMGRLYTFRSNLVDPPIQTAVNDVIQDIAQGLVREERRRKEREAMSERERQLRLEQDQLEDRAKQVEAMFVHSSAFKRLGNHRYEVAPGVQLQVLKVDMQVTFTPARDDVAIAALDMLMELDVGTKEQWDLDREAAMEQAMLYATPEPDHDQYRQSAAY